MTNRTDVLIVGAGPTGLTLAVDLARRGVDAIIVEAVPELPRQSRGKGLQPRTLEVLDDLGVIDEILAHGQWRQQITLYKDGRTLAQLGAGLAEPQPDLPYPNIVMIPQWRITEILADRLAGLGGAVRFSTRLEGFTAGPDDVRAQLTTTDGGREEIVAQYLIGCDGGRSRVRHVLGVGFAGVTRESQRYLLGDVTVPGWEPEADGAVESHAWFGTDGSFLGLAGLPSAGQWQIGASIPADEELEPSLAALQRFWDQRTGRSDVRLSDPTWLSNFQVNVRMVDAYRQGRVLLAGDAAHVHPPTGGQGMNTGMQDAYNLGWKLGALLQGAPDNVLDSYEAERLPVARGVLEKSTDILDVVMSPNPVIAFLVQRILLPLLSRPGINKALTSRVSQIDVGYRGSPLVVDALSGGRVRAGDRAPDALVTDTATGRQLRLFDVFRGPHSTLLLFGPTAVERLEPTSVPDNVHPCLVAETHIPNGWTGQTVRDHNGTVRRAYRATPGTALLIRPDGYVGWRIRNPSTVDLQDRLAREWGATTRLP